MRKLITSFLTLFLVLNLGTKIYGQAAGDYVYVQAASTDSLWATLGNWKISNGSGGYSGDATSLPGATNNVWIATGSKLGTVPTAITSSTCSITSGSTTVTLAAANTNIKVGTAVRNSDNFYGIAPGTYVTNVSTDGLTVTLSAAATRTAPAVKLSYFPACKNLNVSGTFRVSTQFVACGDVTVNTGGVIFQNSDFYCANIINNGTFKATAGYRSAKSLYVGFIGAIPGTGDYSITNDGQFGDVAPLVPQGNFGGIKVLYSNQANSFTVKPSLPSVTTGKFNAAQIMPHSNMTTTANTTLNIKQTMSLLIHNGIGLSVQNNDSCLNTTRTCNIDAGITVYVGYNFHANRNVTTNPQGNFTYNVLGTLDLGTYASASNNTTAGAANTSDFGLCMTTVPSNAGTLTFNLGDGTQANAGTLILGSNLKVIKQRTQTVSVNFKNYSTVIYAGNYGWVMNYQLLNSNTPALYLFPKKYYNLTINGAGVILPVVPVVSGTRTYTTGGYGAAANWVAATTSTQGSIVTTAAGGYYYAPVVRTTSTYIGNNNPITLDGDTIFKYILPNQTISATGISSYTVTSLSSNQLTMSAAVTSTTTQQTNATVSFTGKSDATTAPTGTSTNPFVPVVDGTQALIYLGGAELATGAGYVTAVSNPVSSKEIVYSMLPNQLVIDNATVGETASVFNLSGLKVANTVFTSTKTTLNMASGVYFVKINSNVSKVIVK